jgi:hypothetical protein
MLSWNANLAFGFLTPAFFAAGLLLASVPVIIHILNRRRFKTVNWAAMDFLLRAMRKNRRRLRFEQWLLLLVRCCLLLLLGTALARPLACNSQSLANLAAQRSGLHILIIDNSYSMAYESDRPDAKTNLDQARKLARQTLERLSAGGESVALITAASPATAIIPKPIYDLAAARSAIERIEQSNGGTDLPGALRLADQIAREESRQPNKRLYIFSDATHGAWSTADSAALEKLGKDLARDCHITHYDLSRPGQSNAAVVAVSPTGRLTRASFDNDFRAVVRGYGTSRPMLLQWRLDQQNLSGAHNVSPGVDTPPIVQPLPRSLSGGVHVLSASIAAEDRLKLDDQFRRAIDVAADLKVLIVEGERGAGPMDSSGAFLAAALAPDFAGSAATSQPVESYVAPELISDLEVGNRVLSDYRAIVLAGVGNIQPQFAEQLEKFVRGGGTLLIFMGESVNGENYNATLLPRGLLPGPLTKRVSATGDVPAYYFDFNPHGDVHPLLSVFKGVEKSGLSSARVLSYWEADVPDDAKLRVLNYLPAGATAASTQASHTKLDPAITVHDLGSGRVVWLAIPANEEGLTVKYAYLPLMHELLAGSVKAADNWMNLSVGDSLQIPPSIRLTASPSLKDSQETEVVLEPTNGADGSRVYRSRPLSRAGRYTLSTGLRTIPLVVNVPPEESDIRPVDRSMIRKVLGDVEIDFQSDELPPVSESVAAGNDYGWSVMLIVLTLVCLECFLAMQFGHYRR